VLLEQAGERLRRELRPLVRVENAWSTVAIYRLPDGLKAKMSVHHLGYVVQKEVVRVRRTAFPGF